MAPAWQVCCAPLVTLRDASLPKRSAVLDKSTGWHGTGAVQLLARFTYLDLVGGDPVLTPTSSSAGALAGRQSDITLGVNWYLNSQVWIMANVVLSHIDSVVAGASGDFEAGGRAVPHRLLASCLDPANTTTERPKMVLTPDMWSIRPSGFPAS